MRLRGFQPVLFVAALLAGAAGCAGAGTKDSKAGYVTVCEDRAMTGSSIGRMRCQRKYDVDERQRRDRRFMEQLQNETARRKIVEEPIDRGSNPTGQLVFSAVGHAGNKAATHGRNQKQ